MGKFPPPKLGNHTRVGYTRQLCVRRTLEYTLEYPGITVNLNLLKVLIVVLKSEHEIWYPRETPEERLEETQSNARCFAQGSSLMC